MSEMGNKYNENESIKGMFDEWDSSESGGLARRHFRPRLELFTPLKVSGSPSVNQLTHARVTKGCFLDNGEHFELVDSWSCRGSAHRSLDRPWVGFIKFLLKVDVRICGVSGASVIGHRSQPVEGAKARNGLGHAAFRATVSNSTEGGLGGPSFTTDVCNNSPVKYSHDNYHNSHHVTHRVASLSNKLC